jgi:uncharacterized protein YxeA
MTPEEHENYIGSDEFKKELKIILICMAVLVIIAVAVAIIKNPHYTAEQLYCIKMHPDTRYMCGV